MEQTNQSQEECLCDNPSFDKAISMPLCDKAKCLDYQNELVSLYAGKGFFQPGDTWRESLLQARHVLKYERGQKVTQADCSNIQMPSIDSTHPIPRGFPRSLHLPLIYVLSSVLSTQPIIDFTLSASEKSAPALVEAEMQCGTENANAVFEAVHQSILFCNKPGHEYTTLCRSLSPCGDGIVSWGEACDAGKNGVRTNKSMPWHRSSFA